MIRLATEPWDTYDNKKNDDSKTEWETKILLFTLNCSSIDMWRWIFVQNMISQKEIFIYEILK
jgi:hypothetical protein